MLIFVCATYIICIRPKTLMAFNPPSFGIFSKCYFPFMHVVHTFEFLGSNLSNPTTVEFVNKCALGACAITLSYSIELLWTRQWVANTILWCGAKFVKFIFKHTICYDNTIWWFKNTPSTLNYHFTSSLISF